MKLIFKIFLIIYFTTASNFFAQDSSNSSIPKVPIIFSDAFFIETVVTKSNYHNVPGSKYASPAITFYENHLFNLKFSIKIIDKSYNSIIPLDIKLTSPQKKVKIFHLTEDISEFILNELYSFELEVNENETGWFTFEIGEFLKNKQDINITYDKTKISFRR